MADPDFGQDFLEFFDDDFTSVCNIRRYVVTQDSLGEEVRSPATIPQGLGNIPCRIMPEFGISVRGLTYQPTPSMTVISKTFVVNLQGYFPTITEADEAEVDGIVYRIEGSQCDGSKVSTTLRVELLHA